MTPALAVEIEAERTRQDAKWGGADHDDEHDVADWVYVILGHVSKSRPTPESGPVFRRQMIRVAALAVAAIESCDRKLRLEQELRAVKP